MLLYVKYNWVDCKNLRYLLITKHIIHIDFIHKYLMVGLIIEAIIYTNEKKNIQSFILSFTKRQ